MPRVSKLPRILLTISIIIFAMIKISKSFSFGLNAGLHSLKFSAYRNGSGALIKSSMSMISDVGKLGGSYKGTELPNFQVKTLNNYLYNGDLLIVPFYKPSIEKIKELNTSADEQTKLLAEELKLAVPDLPLEIKTLVTSLLEEGSFKADAASSKLVRVFSSSNTKLPVSYIALVGLGPKPTTKKDKTSTGDLEVTSAQRLGKSIASLAKETKAANVGVALSTGFGNSGLIQVILGVHDNLYIDNRFKKEPSGGFPTLKLQDISFLGCVEGAAGSISKSLTDMVASGVSLAKDLVNAPPNSKTPLVIADVAEEIAKLHNMNVKILGETECKDLNMGGYLGVQQGSKFPPRFIHLTYKPEKTTSDTVKVALIGKGLTFDSGGYNLKAGAGSMIELMKFDMGGCAAVLGAAKAIGQLRPKNVEVHFITAVCENMVSSEAMRPGDILTASNGKTIEVLNTDAEGRLTLADALVYAEKLKPDVIVDLATLTGACIVALGEKVAAVYSPNDDLRKDLEQASLRTGDALWALPLLPQYKDSIKSNIADLKNIGGQKGGGSITAALFLQEFVENTKWAHIDMAGPVWDTSSNQATGFGVKLLVDYILNVKKDS